MSDMHVDALPPSEKPVPEHDHDDSPRFGRGLRRQISVQLTEKQFERLYLQPGTTAQGEAPRRFLRL
jgi:hypothetical protein